MNRVRSIVIAGGGYALMHMESAAPLVGASGAVFGLIGAATRLMGGNGRLLPLPRSPARCARRWCASR